MPLLVKNTTGAPITLDVEDPAPVIPANSTVNVTGELRGRTSQEYTDLEAQKGTDLEYYWDGLAAYDTEDLVVVALAGGALTANAGGRSLIASDFFNAATVLAKFATDSFDAAQLLKLIKDGAFAADTATRALFADGIWTAAKLASAVQQKIIGSIVITVPAEATNNVDFSIQVKDVNGANYSGKVVLRCWLNDANDDSIGTALTAFAVQGTGTLLDTKTANLHLIVMTDANGVAVLRGTIAGAATRYLNASAGSVFAHSAVATWT